MSSPLFGRESITDVSYLFETSAAPQVILKKTPIPSATCLRAKVGGNLAGNRALTGVIGGSSVTKLEEIIMHTRALLAVTLLTIVWFSSSKPMSSQGRPEGAREAGKVQFDIHSVQELARYGDVKAADWLGWSYMTGTGVSQNYYQAAQWFRQAAEQGFADAEFALGYLYEQGKGVGRDYRKAVVYYAAAARQGHATAENNLASMYEHGQGAQRDLRKQCAGTGLLLSRETSQRNVTWRRCISLAKA